MTAHLVPFPLSVRHWPGDHRTRGLLPPSAAVAIWRPTRCALFWVMTDDVGRVVEVWPLAYGITEAHVDRAAERYPTFVHRDAPELPRPAARPRRRRGQ